VRPLPPLTPVDGWREVPIDEVDEGLIRVADLGGRVREDPRYHAMGLPGSLPGCWLRERVCERLVRAAAGLDDGHTLVVWDGYRTLETQTALYDGYLDELTLVHPDWPAEALEAAASRYVSVPSASPSAPSPHLTGGAVDVTLGDGDGRPLDLGTSFDAFVPEAGAVALEGAPGQARERRRALFWAMAAAGFTIYPEEWWHFDLGDQFWGRIAGRPASYGPSEAPRDAG